MENQPTSLDILEAINAFAEATERRFERIETDIGGMKTDIGGMKTDIGGMKTDIGGMKTDIGGMKATMVTKDYLDEKLGSLRGDLVLLIRKENMKLAALIEGMLREKVISQDMAQQILQMEPFPHLSV